MKINLTVTLWLFEVCLLETNVLNEIHISTYRISMAFKNGLPKPFLTTLIALWMNLLLVMVPIVGHAVVGLNNHKEIQVLKYEISKLQLIRNLMVRAMHAIYAV